MISMPAIRLDHQARSRRRLRRGTALLALALAGCAATGAYYAWLMARAQEWEAGAERLERAAPARTGDGRGAARATAELAAEVRRANEAVHAITLPWDRLFRAVESAASADVALLGLEPNPDKRTVKISGEAKTMASLLAYMRTLQGSGVFGAVYLQNHRVQRQDAQKPVRFMLVADWREDA